MSLRETLAHLFHPRRSNNHRPRVLHAKAYGYFMALSLLVVGLLQLISYAPGRLGNVLGFASSITPAQVVEQTNQQRAQVGLPPLTLNATLSQAALSKGQDMLSKQYWAHTSPEGKEPWAFMRAAGYGYQVAGENLARDFSNTGDMMQAWMASPTHRANIVNTRYKEIGIAVIDGELQGVQTTLVVQMFGTRRTAAAQVGESGSAAPTTANRPATIPVASPAVVASPAPVASVQPEPTPAVEPVAQPEFVPVELAQAQLNPAADPDAIPTPMVLARALVPIGELSAPPLFTPLQLTKAFFLAVILLLVLTLTYDGVVIGHRSTVRLVGKNLGHIIYLVVVAFLLILFKGGIVG